jgi:Prohead core protein serine protease
MKLITEVFEDVEFLTEKREDGKKDHYIKGIFLQSNVINRNKRIYPEHVMDKEVARYIKEMVNSNRAYGELGHPPTPSINLDRVSHIITELKKDGYNYVGKAKLTDTPMGHIARGLLESGGGIGVSSRGVGSLKQVGESMEVQGDYRLATAGDIVHDPSAPKAFVEGIMENVDWIYDPAKDTWLEQRIDELKSSIKKMSMREIEERKLSIFENYLSSLATKNT